MDIKDLKKLGIMLKDVDLDNLDAIHSYFDEGFGCLDTTGLDKLQKQHYLSYFYKTYGRNNVFVIDNNEDCDCMFITKEDISSYRKSTKYIGLRYYGDSNELRLILQNNPEIDVVGLEINYLDWILKRGDVKSSYNVCKEFNKLIFAYNTDKNRSLINMSSNTEDILRNYDPYSSTRSWAIKFVKSLPNVNVIFTNPKNKKDLYDDIITIKYKSNEIDENEFKCLKEVCRFL